MAANPCRRIMAQQTTESTPDQKPAARRMRKRTKKAGAKNTRETASSPASAAQVDISQVAATKPVPADGDGNVALTKTPPRARRSPKRPKGRGTGSAKTEERQPPSQDAEKPEGRRRPKRKTNRTRKPQTAENQPQPSTENEKPTDDAQAAPAEASPATEKEPPAEVITTPALSSRSKRNTDRSRTKRRGSESDRNKSRPGQRPAQDKAPQRKATHDAAASRKTTGKTAKSRSGREMLINVSGGDECRIAVLLNGRLEELFLERASTQSHVGNIYKGRITNIEPTIQAAFIDFGLHQNGFLHISDVQPQYFPDHDGEGEDVGRKIPRHHRPKIQDCFRRGQEVIVQVTREGVGTKGPTLTTYLSLPGRFLVMMPGMNRHGVSRKIEDEAERRTMRDQLRQLDLPSGMGFILRTAGLGKSNRELQRDLQYLMRLWKTVVERIKKHPAPAELYRESDLVTRTIRDVYTTDFTRLIVDDPDTAQRATEFLQLAMPRSKPVVETYDQREPLFHRYGIDDEIERIHNRHVPLPSGGSLVIDSTEALVAIDVNSGRTRVADDADETVFQTNLEAAEEIARQLRLRDLGGLIVCDFIDMRLESQKRAVEKALKDALKQHKERARTLRLSAFGLLEITRQRQGPSLKRNIYGDCTHCKGTGLIKMPDSVILDVMRGLQLATSHTQVKKVTISVAADVAFQILNTKRSVLSKIEGETGKRVLVQAGPGFRSDQVSMLCTDERGQPVSSVPSMPGIDKAT